jgi:protein-disulfide isomerase
MRSWPILVVAAAAVAALPATLPAQQTDAPLAGRSKGSASAPVTVYEMSDFQCPYCRRFALETFPTLEREYVGTGKVRWIFVNFPISEIHPNAAAAAAVALCAARQNAFWRVHDFLYTYQDTWAPLKEPGPFFTTLADSAKISKKAMLTCLESPDTPKEIQSEAEGSRRAGANSTPSFYIEGGLMSGAQSLEVFRRVLDSVVATKHRPGT